MSTANYSETVSNSAEPETRPTFWEALREQLTSWKSLALHVASAAVWLLVYYLTGSVLAIVVWVAFVLVVGFASERWRKRRSARKAVPTGDLSREHSQLP